MSTQKADTVPSKDSNTPQAKTSHTPGPWKLHRHSSTSVFADSIGNVIANCGGWGDTRRDGGEVLSQQEANARLVAAAPELLQQLKRSMKPEHHRENGKCVEGQCDRCDIEAVIRKAEGL